MSFVKYLVPEFLLKPYRNLQRRVTELERAVWTLDTAFDALVVTPEYTPGEEVGFNGQRERKKIFEELLSTVKFEVVLETGTFLGNTTGFLAQTSRLPVYSCELNPRFHALAKRRLAAQPSVQLTLKDSR